MRFRDNTRIVRLTHYGDGRTLIEYAAPIPSEQATAARRICEHVDGAPFQPGDRVVVAELSDTVGDSKRVGQVGAVEALWYDGGCGEVYPERPLVDVRFEDGGAGQFWPEELRPDRCPECPQGGCGIDRPCEDGGVQ